MEFRRVLFRSSLCQTSDLLTKIGAVPRPSEMRWVRRTLRVPPLHFIEFLGRDLRQVPDEQNKALGLRGSVRSAEGWHAAQTNSIVNCVVELRSEEHTSELHCQLCSRA